MDTKASRNAASEDNYLTARDIEDGFTWRFGQKVRAVNLPDGTCNITVRHSGKSLSTIEELNASMKKAISSFDIQK